MNATARRQDVAPPGFGSRSPECTLISGTRTRTPRREATGSFSARSDAEPLSPKGVKSSAKRWSSNANHCSDALRAASSMLLASRPGTSDDTSSAQSPPQSARQFRSPNYGVVPGLSSSGTSTARVSKRQSSGSVDGFAALNAKQTNETASLSNVLASRVTTLNTIPDTHPMDDKHGCHASSSSSQEPFHGQNIAWRSEDGSGSAELDDFHKQVCVSRVDSSSRCNSRRNSRGNSRGSSPVETLTFSEPPPVQSVPDELPSPPDSPKPTLSALLTRRRHKFGLDASSQAPRPLAVQVQSSHNESKRTIRQLEENVKIYDVYYWEEVLQESGDGGKVVICQPKDGAKTPKQKRSEFKYVMKMRSKANLVAKRLDVLFRATCECMLNFPPHENVMRPHEVLEDESFFYVIMDRASGGALFEALSEEFSDGIMPESAVQNIMRDILQAVSFVHKQGVIHRDIKPDNFVMQIKDHGNGNKTKHVMLIDFDHADPSFTPCSSAHRNSWFGTLRFNAPETYHGQFSEQSDLYSVGCILYLLMAGKMPYSDHIFDDIPLDAEEAVVRAHRTRIFRDMREATIDFRCNPWPKQTVCRDFCRSLLSFQPNDRPMSADNALQHDWFQQATA